MDPNLQAVLLGLLTNGLTAFIAQFGRKDSKLILGEALVKRIKWEETAVQPILQKAANTVAEKIDWQGVPPLEIVCLFLTSPEAQSIIRQLFATQITLHDKHRDLTSIREEFLISFYLYATSYSSCAELKEDQFTEVGNTLIESLLEGCEQALNIAINEGNLPSHEAKSAFRHRLLVEELAAIQEKVTFLTSRQKPNVKEILAFEETYRRLVGNRHKYITPPNFGRVRQILINKLYVSPDLETFETTLSHEDKSILSSKGQILLDTFDGLEKNDSHSYRNVFSGTFRAVILGNPGGGKSTLAQKLCYDLSTHYSERIFSGRNNITPIMVILRDYGPEKKNHDRSILEFIQAKAKAEFQLQPPSGAFEYLLSNGRVMVIFDGLDELLDTRDRQEVSKAVEAFCTLYPSVPVLVTSREVGFEQAPLDGEVFEIFRLANFNESQVREYVTKWFNVITDSVSEKKKLKAESFLEESQMVPDLRTNPLMLSLLCNIYQEENYIPTNRPDVYEKCANMLFERWDRSRGINVNLSFDIYLRPTMTYLAHWIYSSENLRGGITEEKLISKTTEYLRGKLLEDEAQKVAREFIEFFKGRAWVFTNTGSTKYGEELYQFTHQTFLEYFTAIYLCRNNPTPAQLLKVLRPRIIKREWDVIAQLAFQKQSRDLEGAGNYLLATLLKQAKTSETEMWYILSFAARCLEFMIPSPYIIQEIISLCIKHSILWGVEHSSKKYAKKKNEPPKPEEIFNYLLNSASDNQKIVAIELENQIIAHAKSDNELEAVMVLEIGIHLQSLYSTAHRLLNLRTKATNLRKSDEGKIWNTESNRIITDCSEQLKKFSERHLSLCIVSQRDGLINLAEIAKWHGVASIFETIHSTMIPSISWTSVADFFLSRSILVEQNHLDVARQIGSIILNNPPPWFIDKVQFTQIGPHGIKAYLYYQPPNSTKNTLEYDADVLFGYFTLFMVFSEALYVGNRKITTATIIEGKRRTIEISIIKDIKNSIHPIMHSIRWILIARYKHSNAIKDLTAPILEKVQLELDKCNFTSEQQEFIWLWVKREISLF